MARCFIITLIILMKRKFLILPNKGLELLIERAVNIGQTMDLEPWGVIIIEEDQAAEERKQLK